MATPCRGPCGARSAGCVSVPSLPREIRSALLKDIVAQTRLSPQEVKTLYERFRRLAPCGYLSPEEFKQSMGVIGLTADAFLPNRMFNVFDTSGDGQLDFKDFATSLAVMLRGTEDEKLTLSFQMAAGKRDAAGLTLEDFTQLVKACNGMMASLFVPSFEVSSDADIQRLFCELVAPHGEMTRGNETLMSLESYKRAVRNSPEFLACLGLQPNRARKAGQDGVASTAATVSQAAASVSSKATESVTSWQVQKRQPRDRCYNSHLESQAGYAAESEEPLEGQVLVSAKLLGELRERVEALSQIARRTPVADKEGSAIQEIFEQRETPETDGNANIGFFQSLFSPAFFSPWCSIATSAATADGEQLVEVHAQTSLSLPQATVDLEGENAMNVAAAEKLRSELEELLSLVECVTPRMPASTEKGSPLADAEQLHKEQAEASMPVLAIPPTPKVVCNEEAGDRPVLLGRQRVGSANKKHHTVRLHALLGPKKGLAVHFGHERWNTVLSMMIGIRMSVGRSKHEILRELVPVDFVMKEKFSINPALTNLLDQAASKRVTMTRFIDYSPMVFQRIRMSFGIQNDEYLRSVGPEKLLGNMVLGNLASLSELTSEGKSGAFFYYTADGKYMMKTVTKKEYYLLRHMLKRYYEHIVSNPGTLICRFLGLHCLSVQTQRRVNENFHSHQKMYFVVMANMFNTPFEIHHKYDLKGSWVGRVTASDIPAQTLKDVDFTQSNMKIKVGKENADRLVAQMQRDSEFLRDNNIIDYSLLVGIHEINGGDQTIDDAGQDDVKHQTTSSCSHLATAQATEDRGSNDATVPLHQRHMGGLLSSDHQSLYLLGIIDILTPYDSSKRLEHHAKALLYESEGVSCCPPGLYASRFTSFMQDALV